MKLEIYGEETEKPITRLRLVKEGDYIALIVATKDGKQYPKGSKLVTIHPDGKVKVWKHLDPDCPFPLNENYGPKEVVF